MNDSRNGFTLLEVLVTIVILSVAIWSLSALQTMSVGQNYTSHRMTIATMLAQDKLEELKSLAWNDSQLTDTQNNFTVDTNADGVFDDFDWTQPTDHTNSDGPGNANNPIDESGAAVPATYATSGYYRTWNIADGVPGANMKTISVRVDWSEQEQHSVTIKTIMSEG